MPDAPTTSVELVVFFVCFIGCSFCILHPASCKGKEWCGVVACKSLLLNMQIECYFYQGFEYCSQLLILNGILLMASRCCGYPSMSLSSGHLEKMESVDEIETSVSNSYSAISLALKLEHRGSHMVSVIRET